jgi:cytochrome c-type biogenesis protein CcmH/NrfG
LYLEIGEVDKAIARLEASVRQNPEDPEAHFRLGSACGRKAQQRPKDSAGWIARAEKEFRTADRLRGIPNPPLEPPGKPRI